MSNGNTPTGGCALTSETLAGCDGCFLRSHDLPKSDRLEQKQSRKHDRDSQYKYQGKHADVDDTVGECVGYATVRDQ